MLREGVFYRPAESFGVAGDTAGNMARIPQHAGREYVQAFRRDARARLEVRVPRGRRRLCTNQPVSRVANNLYMNNLIYALVGTKL